MMHGWESERRWTEKKPRNNDNNSSPPFLVTNTQNQTNIKNTPLANTKNKTATIQFPPYPPTILPPLTA